MESHPVPQNVTSFEFHLIGDMTIKQFAYLAAGLVSAYLTFLFAFTSSPAIAIPLIIIFTGSGVAFAFLPIADRPLDHWVVSFFKAVYSPTKRLWQKDKQSIDPNSLIFQNRLNIYLKGPQSITTLSTQGPAITKNPVTGKNPDITRLLTISTQNSQPVFTRTQPSPQNLTQQLQSQVKPNPIVQPIKVPISPITSAPLPSIPHPPYLIPKSLTPPTVSGPNIIAGTTLTSLGQVVEAAIIVITNENNIPLRALKTNKLGQFTSVTPLPNGSYILNSEKEGFLANPLKIELKGEIIQPVVIGMTGATA